MSGLLLQSLPLMVVRLLINLASVPAVVGSIFTRSQIDKGRLVGYLRPNMIGPRLTKQGLELEEASVPFVWRGPI